MATYGNILPVMAIKDFVLVSESYKLRLVDFFESERFDILVRCEEEHVYRAFSLPHVLKLPVKMDLRIPKSDF